VGSHNLALMSVIQIRDGIDGYGDGGESWYLKNDGRENEIGMW
jgi:hypothetical protein